MNTTHGPGDLTSTQPLFQQIIDLLTEKARSGEWPIHTKLKDEIALAAELGVSRGTLRRAIKELIRRGLLVQMKGRGTFVVSNTMEQPLATRLISFSEAMDEQGISYTTSVLGCLKELPDPTIRAHLELSPSEEAWRIERVRSTDAGPIIYLLNWVPLRVMPGVGCPDLEAIPLFELIEQRGSLRLDWGRRYFRAVAAEPSQTFHLGVPPGHPLLFLEQIVYSTSSTPVEYSNVWINTTGFDVEPHRWTGGDASSGPARLHLRPPNNFGTTHFALDRRPDSCYITYRRSVHTNGRSKPAGAGREGRCTSQRTTTSARRSFSTRRWGSSSSVGTRTRA